MSIPKADIVAQITGKTDVYAFVSHPVAQARAPELINPMFRARGVDAVMVGLDVPTEAFDDAMKTFVALGNFKGMIISVPHKARALPFACKVSARAEAVGAVNCLKKTADGRWIGDMFDGLGFVRGLEAAKHPIKGREALLVGAGGAGAAIAHALADAGIARLSVFDVDDVRAAELVTRVQAFHPNVTAEIAPAHPAGHHMVINATPLGMKETDPYPIDPDCLTPDVLVVEAIMKPPVTRLLKAAENKGCSVHPGAPMLDNQMAEFVEFLLSADA